MSTYAYPSHVALFVWLAAPGNAVCLTSTLSKYAKQFVLVESASRNNTRAGIVFVEKGAFATIWVGPRYTLKV